MKNLIKSNRHRGLKVVTQAKGFFMKSTDELNAKCLMTSRSAPIPSFSAEWCSPTF